MPHAAPRSATETPWNPRAAKSERTGAPKSATTPSSSPPQPLTWQTASEVVHAPSSNEMRMPAALDAAAAPKPTAPHASSTPSHDDAIEPPARTGGTR